MKLVNCICGHRHPHKSRCGQGVCQCRYGTDNRRASDRIIASWVGRAREPGMKILRKYFTPENITQALKAERSNEI